MAGTENHNNIGLPSDLRRYVTYNVDRIFQSELKFGTNFELKNHVHDR